MSDPKGQKKASRRSSRSQSKSQSRSQHSSADTVKASDLGETDVAQLFAIENFDEINGTASLDPNLKGKKLKERELTEEERKEKERKENDKKKELDAFFKGKTIKMESHVRDLIEAWVDEFLKAATKKVLVSAPKKKVSSATSDSVQSTSRVPIITNAPNSNTANTENRSETGRENFFHAYTQQYPAAQANTSDDGQESKSSEASNPWESYPGNPHGSLITKGSRSDFAVLNTETGELFEFEFKFGTSDKTLIDAFHQLVGYLYNQLWWFRSVQGLSVERVRGFAVLANTKKECRIVIVEISMPQKIGGKFKLLRHVINDRNKGLEAMETVLNTSFHTVSELMGAKPSFPIGCPGAMMIPPTLLKRNEGKWCLGQENKECVWDLVENGTGNLVLRFTPVTSSIMTEKDIKERVDAAKSFLQENVEFMKVRKYPETSGSKRKIESKIPKSLMDFIEECKKHKKTIYIKIKGRGSGKYWKSILVEYIHRSEIEWMNKLYPKQFFIRNDSNNMILMRHVGCRLDELEEKRKLGWSSFCSKFLQLIKDTIRVQEATLLIHGDIHAGNLLYDEDKEKLCIIDWDEAFDVGAPRYRIGRNDRAKEIYPDVKWTDPLCLTMVQLIILFRDVIRENYDKDLQFCKGASEGRNEVMEQSPEEIVGNLKIVDKEKTKPEKGLLWPLLKKQKEKIENAFVRNEYFQRDAEGIVETCYNAFVRLLENEASSDDRIRSTASMDMNVCVSK